MKCHCRTVTLGKVNSTFSDELKGELDVEGAGAVQVPGHQHTQAVLPADVT